MEGIPLGYTTIKFKHWGVMWEISYNHLYTCCERNQCDTSYHTQLRTYNTTIKLYCFMCDHGYTIIFSEVYNSKLLKRGVIMNIPSYLQSVWWIYSGRRIYYATIKYYDIGYWGHNARTQGGAKEEVIGGMAGHFTWWGVRCHTIKKSIVPTPPSRHG